MRSRMMISPNPTWAFSRECVSNATGTEMEARPFGPDPETATGETPEPTRGTEAWALDYPDSTSLHLLF